MDTVSTATPYQDKGPTCNGQCTGYGTCNNCPPLIEFAMAIAQRINLQAKPRA